MKTILASILFIGFANLTYSQTDIAYTTHTNLTAMKGLENNYVKPTTISSDEAISLTEKLKQLQVQVLNYDIKSADVYSPEANTTYTVNFTEGNNHIDAVYAKDGRFIQSEAVFENLPIPYQIGYELAKTYPGWEFHKTWCYTTYNTDQSYKKSYKIQLKKNNRTKFVMIDAPK